MTIDKYVLRHSDGLVMPLLHLHREGAAGTRTMLWISDHGKAGAADWGAMQKLLADGYDVVTFDGRGLGETRMRYRAVSEDDPTLVAGDFDSAYVSPLSSVLADYVYNTLLTGRPYLLQMIEDVDADVVLDQLRRARSGDWPATTVAEQLARRRRLLAEVLDQASGLLTGRDGYLVGRRTASRWPRHDGVRG